MSTTQQATVAATAPGPGGWLSLGRGPGEPHTVRDELLPGAPADAQHPATEALLTIAHLSDLHVCDSQSPARLEFLDRWADHDAPTRSALLEPDGVGIIGSYRAQDLLTAQVVDAAVRAVNAVRTGPVGGAPLDVAVVTGDVTDNAQANELDWYLRLLEGGRVHPDSGADDRYDGVAAGSDPAAWHEAYWHPEPSTAGVDRPHRLHGFPDAPGLLDSVRRPFQAAGLDVPWLAVHGNHDLLLQGTVPAVGPFARATTAGETAVDVPLHWTPAQVLELLGGLAGCRPEALAALRALPRRPVTPDPARRSVTRAQFVAAHWGERARPAGHGFVCAASAVAHHRTDHGRVTVLALDTVNHHGGWQGSLDRAQLAWLEGELVAADREHRYVVLASHHPLRTLVNAATTPAAGPRALRRDVEAVLAGHRCLVLWLNGHTHTCEVTAHAGRTPWWEVTTPSLIDHPQQSRIVELLRAPDGTLTIAATMVDHAGELPWAGGVGSVDAMAGLSRELAVNDWQVRTPALHTHPAAGTRRDRNVLLRLPDPFPSAPAAQLSAAQVPAAVVAG